MAALSFFKTLGKDLLKIAPTAVTAVPGFGPALGIILNLAIPAIQHAAQKDIPDAAKKTEVLQTLEKVALPELIKILPPDVVKDPTKFTQGADTLVEALLDLLKSTGDVASKPAPAPAPISVISNLDTNSSVVPPPAGVYKVIGTLNITQ